MEGVEETGDDDGDVKGSEAGSANGLGRRDVETGRCGVRLQLDLRFAPTTP